MVSAGDLGRILYDCVADPGVAVSVAGDADVPCGNAHRGCAFFPCRFLACSLDSSVRFRL